MWWLKKCCFLEYYKPASAERSCFRLIHSRHVLPGLLTKSKHLRLQSKGSNTLNNQSCLSVCLSVCLFSSHTQHYQCIEDVGTWLPRHVRLVLDAEWCQLIAECNTETIWIGNLWKYFLLIPQKKSNFPLKICWPFSIEGRTMNHLNGKQKLSQVIASSYYSCKILCQSIF
jgi:hypothetical protein